jgi:two-component system, chemotaxis family, CheB/CheR fusion protein
LRAANEELQSINEEYRSTSEELETSKEELQSINEELQTVNSELKLKLEAISRAHSDLQNLMAATDFGTLFLDSGLRIKRFTDRVTELFSVTPTDEGRPITDFAHQLEYDDLIKDARAVLSDLAPIRRELKSRNGKWYDMRLRPYRTVDDKIDGVVITFVDVSDRRQVEDALRESERKLRQLRKK